MPQNEDLSIQTLMKLGLTVVQAKTYLTIVVLKKASAMKISTVSKIVRPDVYRVLPVLENMGLVRKISTTPTQFEATPLKQGCAILLHRKKDEYSQIVQDTTSLIDDFYKPPGNLQETVDNNFVLVSSDKLLLEKLLIENSNAKTTIDVVGHWFAIRPLVFGYRQIFPKALKRGIRIRILTEKPTDEKIGDIINNPLFEMRVLNETVPIKAVIYDGKSANMCVGTSNINDITPSLWSGNPAFVKVVTTYFENIWSEAETIKN